MPLNSPEDHGKNADGTLNEDYCHHCYANGQFTHDITMQQEIEACIPFVLGGQPYHTEQEAREAMQQFFPTLKRWKNNH